MSIEEQSLITPRENRDTTRHINYRTYTVRIDIGNRSKGRYQAKVALLAVWIISAIGGKWLAFFRGGWAPSTFR